MDMKAILLLLIFATAPTFEYCIYKYGANYREAEIIARSSNNFGFTLFQKIPKSQNGFVSPISISMLLGMVYSGAKGNTAKELRKGMKYPESVHLGFREIFEIIAPPKVLKSNQKGYTLEMANAMVVDTGFNLNSSYRQLNREYFRSSIGKINFSRYYEDAVLTVNSYVKRATKNKISKIMEKPFEPLTKMFLMNAMYFNGTWKTKFDHRFTTPDTFYNYGRIPKTVPMMKQKQKYWYGFDDNIQAHILELPYDGEDITMMLLLPNRRNGLQELESLLSEEVLTDSLWSMREVSVHVTLPKFNLEQSYDLIPVLKKMGIKSIFHSDTSNLLGISSTPGLYVTKAIHRCAVEIHEDGTEAAAASGLTLNVRRINPFYPVFYANHPFLFVIRDSRINLNLFIGRVTKL